MRRVRILHWLVLVVALCSSCKERRSAAPPATQAEGGPSGPTTPESDDAGAPLPPLFTGEVLPVQLDETMTRAEFLGWSRDGNLYAVETARGLDLGELGGRRAIEVREVRDARTGQLMALFRLSRAIDDDVAADDPLRKAWAEAQPVGAWKAYAAEHGFVKDTSPPADWSVEVGVEPEVPLLSKVSVANRGLTHGLEWRTWQKPRTPAEKEALVRAAGRDRSEHAAAFTVSLTSKKGSWQVAELRAPYTVGLIGEAYVSETDDSIVHGSLSTYWSPDGQRILLLVAWDAQGLNDEMVQPAAEMMVRGVGPQVRVSGGGPAATSAVVRRIEGLGIPVAEVSLTDQAAPVSWTVQVRGASGRSAAAEIASALGTGPEAAAGPGWAHIEIVAHPAPASR